MLCQRWKSALGHLPGYANSDSMSMATVELPSRCLLLGPTRTSGGPNSRAVASPRPDQVVAGMGTMSSRLRGHPSRKRDAARNGPRRCSARFGNSWASSGQNVFSKPQPAVVHRGVPQPDKLEIASSTSAATVTNRPRRPQSYMLSLKLPNVPRREIIPHIWQRRYNFSGCDHAANGRCLDLTGDRAGGSICIRGGPVSKFSTKRGLR